MNKYGLQNKFFVIDGKKDQLISLLLKASKLVLASDSCYLYMISIDKSVENCIWVNEVWESREAHDKALMDPKVYDLIIQALPLLTDMPEKGRVLEIIEEI